MRTPPRLPLLPVGHPSSQHNSRSSRERGLTRLPVLLDPRARGAVGVDRNHRRVRPLHHHKAHAIVELEARHALLQLLLQAARRVGRGRGEQLSGGAAVSQKVGAR